MQTYLRDPSIEMTTYYYNALKDKIVDMNGDIIPVYDFVPQDSPNTYIWISDQYVDQDVIVNINKGDYATQFTQLIQVNITYEGYMVGGKLASQHINKQIIEKIITNDEIILDGFKVLDTVLDNIFITNEETQNGVVYISLIRVVSDIYQL